MAPSKIALGSPLHRLLRLTPGFVPTWICSRDNYTGFELLIGLEVCLVLGGVLLGQFQGHWWLLAVLIPPVVAFGFFVHVPFMRQEQRARARRRRGECVWCGQSRGDADRCRACGLGVR